MKIFVDGEEYLVPPEERALLVQQFQAIALDEYRKMNQDLRFVLKPLARHQLKKLEDEARTMYGKDRSLAFRPDKGGDPVVHYSKFLATALQEMMQHVTFRITTNDHTIAAISFAVQGAGEGGRQMVTHGDERLRENDWPEIS